MSDALLDDRDRSGGARRPTVLVVDDDAGIRTLLTVLFETEGYRVTVAAHGGEALEALRAEAPDCIVLDLMMPVLDGRGVLEARRREGLAADARVVILTARGDPRDTVWCWELGADEYLTKPFEPDDLLREVRLLQRRSPEEVRHRREQGLEEARRLDEMEAAFHPRTQRH